MSFHFVLLMSEEEEEEEEEKEEEERFPKHLVTIPASDGRVRQCRTNLSKLFPVVPEHLQVADDPMGHANTMEA